MKYKIEIWQYRSITTTYENDDVKEILNRYRENWSWIYDNGGCSFSIYENGRLLSFEEENELGFHEIYY